MNITETPLKRPTKGYVLDEGTLTHTDIPLLSVKVQVPNSEGIVEVNLTLGGQRQSLGVDTGKIATTLQEMGILMDAAGVQGYCKTDRFEELIQPLKWRGLLTRIVKKEELDPIIRTLFARLPEWKEKCEEKCEKCKEEERDRIKRTPFARLPERKEKCKKCKENEVLYFPPKTIPISQDEKIRYPIEYRKDGTLLLFYVYECLGLGIGQSGFVCDLKMGKIFQTVEYELEKWQRIAKMPLLFTGAVGLIHLQGESFQEEIMKTGLRRRFCVGFHETYDSNLAKYADSKSRFSFVQKRNMALNLLLGLEMLEQEQILHCGIVPPAILLRYTEEKLDEVEGVISSFEKAYLRGDWPEKFPRPSLKWKQFMPPECLKTPLKKLKYPFKIAVYQMGLCFRTLFGEGTPLAISDLIDLMINPDPEKRISATEAKRYMTATFTSI